MGFLKALFGSPKPKARPYVDEGFALTKKFITLFDLADWASGTPVSTQQEARAIERELRDFQPIVDAAVQRMFGAQALHRLAGPDVGLSWELDDDCPDDWKTRVSTYLKAWAMNLDPDVLLDMARLLAVAGYKTEAKQSAAIVACWFPSYAPRFFAGASDPKLVASITAGARELMKEISETEKRGITTPEKNRMNSPLSQPADNGSAMQEYPTDEELQEALEAHEKREDALLALIQKNRAKREESSKATTEEHKSKADAPLSKETIQEFLDVHKEGGEKAILALLRKKKAEREERRANAAKRQHKNDPNNIFNLELRSEGATGEPTLNPNTPPESTSEHIKGYPTPEQIEEMFNAYQKDGKAGIGRVLDKRAEESKTKLEEAKKAYPPGLFDRMEARSKARTAEPTSKPNTPQPSRYVWTAKALGPATKPPSEEAEAYLYRMNAEDRKLFDDELRHWHSAEVALNPLTRSCIWGYSLANLAEHYREMGAKDSAFTWMNGAWIVSKYPLFAYNAALLALSLGHKPIARHLFGSFLDNYQDVLESGVFDLMEPKPSEDELKQMVSNARERYAALEGHRMERS